MPLLNISRALLVATLLCALMTLFVPAKASAASTAKPSCCSTMKASDDADDCPMHQHAPVQQEEDSPCCHICALGLALLFVAPPDFVYAATGDASLVSLIADSHSLSHRPPVPPPRVALS